MREGLSLSHDGAADLVTIKKEWTASDNQLLDSLTQSCRKDNNNLQDVIYHACGNTHGLHWTS